MADTVVHLLVAASVDAARSAAIALVLAVIGAPVWHPLASRLNGGRLQAGLAVICGLAVLSVFSWYAYRFGLNVGSVYSALIGIGAVWLLVAAWLRRSRLPSPKALLAGAAEPAAAFFVPVLIYGVLGHSRLAPGTLPLLSSGNNDLLMYLKAADVLLRLPDVATQVGPLNLGQWLAGDVFAAYNLLALSAFVLRTGVVECAMPLLGLGVGLIGLAIATVCRRIFALSLWQAVLVAVLFTTSPLFSYISLAYFLSQILFIGVLLAVFAQIAEAANESATRTSAAAAALVGAVATLFVYHPWFLPYCVVASLACGAGFFASHLLRPARIAKAVLTAGAMFVAMNLLAAALGTSRYRIVLDRVWASAVGAEPGWPLPFINPTLFLGLPAWWQTPDAGPSILSQTLPALVVLGVLAFAAWRHDRGERARGRRFALVCLLSVVALYFAAWFAYGLSYRQWKFATTLVAPFGFVGAATLLHLCAGVAARRARGPAVAAASLFLLFSIGGNVSQYLDRWGASVLAFPQDLRRAARADRNPATDAVYIDLPGFGEKMAAAVFVRRKPIFFSGPTYFGPGDSVEALPFKKIAVMRQACATKAMPGPGGTRYTLSRPGVSGLRPGSTFLMSTEPGDCMQLQGFSGAEPWGRWTDGKTAGIRMRCACDLTKKKVRLVLKAGAFFVAGRLERQRVGLSVNGGARQDLVIEGGQTRDIALDVPPAPGDRSAIDVKIELPDALSPASVSNSADPRVLGLSVTSVALDGA